MIKCLLDIQINQNIHCLTDMIKYILNILDSNQ